MSGLEDLVYQQLTQDTTLAGMLAKFSGQPALFEYHAPPDTDPGWQGQKQYPRLDYMVERREDPERRVSGLLIINVWQDNSADDTTTLESVANQVMSILDGSMYHPTDEPVIGFRWSRGQAFTAGREQGDVSMADLPPTDLLYGMYLEFDLLAFPMQTTYSPDPVTTLNTWASNVFGSQLQVDVSAWTPTSGTPALYWRFETMQAAQMQQAVTWYDATIYGHVLAPMPWDRLTWTRKIVEAALNVGSFVMDNGSTLLLQRVVADTKQDQLRVGQIRMVVRYGIAVPEDTATALTQANVSGAVSGGVTSG